MKKVKLILFSLLLCFGMVFISACKEEEPPVLATGIYLSETSAELTLGDFATFEVTITPDDAASKDFEVNALTQDVVTIDYNKEQMQFTVNAPNTLPNGFDTVELEVKTTDGSNLNTHLTITLKQRVTYIQTPTDLHYNGSELVWTEVVGAKGYKLNINGTDMPIVYTNSYAIDDSFIGQDIVARVYAVAEDDSLSSGFSEYTFKILAAPTNLTYQDGTISWDAVDGATGYNVYFDGKVSFTEYTQNYVLDRFSEPKTYQIKVLAVGDDQNHIESSVYSGMIEVTKLDIPSNLRISNGVVMWDAIQNAQNYKFYLDNNEPVATGLNQLVLPQSLTAGKHTFEIAACGDEKTYISSFISPELSFEKLEKIENMYIENGSICWSPNLQATSYRLYVDGMPYQTTNLDVTTVDFADYNSGTYQLNVRAIGNGGNILDSDLMPVSLEATKLATPNNLRIEKTADQNYFAWDAVENAGAYLVAVNNNDPVVVTEPKYLLQVTAGSYSVKVVALGDSTKYITSNYSAMFTSTKLADVKNLTVKNGQVAWDLVAGAGKYQVLINNTQIVETTNNRFDFLSTDANKFEAGVYSVCVKAIASIATNIDSEFCNNISVTKLPAPVVAVRYGALVDAQVDNSSSIEYEIEVLSEAGEVVNKITKYTLDQFGGETYQKYKITARAYAKQPEPDEVMYINSDVSAPFECVQLPKVTDVSISAGIATFATQSYANITDGFRFDINITDLGNADALTNNVTHQLKSTQREYNFTTMPAGKFAYTFTAVPNYNENGESLQQVPYLTSKKSQENMVTVLAAPTNAKISSIADFASDLTTLITKIQTISASPCGTLIWDGVIDATQYVIKIDGVTKHVTETTSCNLLGILADDGAKHKITVEAIGNGADVISSAATPEIECVKLNRPTNLVCNGGSISWSSEYNQNANVSNSTANTVLYVVNINGMEYVTLNFKEIMDSINIFNPLGGLNNALKSKSYDLPELDAGEYAARVYAVPLNGYLKGLNEVCETEGTKYVISEFNTNELNLTSLIAPQGLKMSYINGQQKLTWTPLRYENGEVEQYVITQILGEEETEFEVASDVSEWVFENYEPNTYQFSIYAKAKAGKFIEKNGKNYYYINSNHSALVSTTVMQNPELAVIDGKVCWTEITGVDKYELTFGKVGGATETREFTPAESSFALGEDYTAGDYTFTIRAVGDGSKYITSELCETQTFTKLQAIQNVRLENGVIKYNENATVALQDNDCYYQLVVNSREVSNQKLVATELEGFNPGNYTLKVYAFGDSNKYLTSNASNVLECIKLYTPTSLSLKAGVLTWVKANNASSYQINISGSIVGDIQGVSYEFADLDCGDYQVGVKAIGNNTSYVNSDWTKNIVISKLEEVKNLRVENGAIAWDEVGGSYNDLRLKIKHSTEAQFKEVQIESGATTYALDDTYIAGTYSVCMYNAGGATAISSSETDVIQVVKLEVPQNMQIVTEDSLQYLTFNSVANAGNYTIRIVFDAENGKQTVEFDVSVTKIPTSSLEGFGVSIQSSGTYVLSVMANGTVSPYVDSDYSSNLTITKPEAPTLVDVKTAEGMSSGLVTWNAVENADYYRVVMIKDDVVDTEFVTTNTHVYVSNKANYTIQVTSCKNLNGFDSETSQITLSYALYDGSGTQADPYRVKTAVDFNNIVYNPTACYKLVNDINFGEKALSAICTEQAPFVGTIDGNSYKVIGATITSYNAVVGLVPVIGQTGKVKNLTVDITITSGKTAGGIAAINYGTIENCVVSGTISPVYNVTSTALNAAGIAAYNYGKIDKCINNATINPQNNMNITYAGGIVATNSGNISGCGNNGAVSATYAGGIAAYTTSSISYSYNNFAAVITATTFNNGITCYAYAGGIAGYAYSSSVDAIEFNTCYSVGTVAANSQYNAIYPYAGGLVGYNDGAKLANCYASSVSLSGNIILSVTTNNNGKGYVGNLVGFNAKGTIAQSNLSVCQNTNQVDAYTNSGFINRRRFIYNQIDELTLVNNLSGYTESQTIYPTIKDNAKY